MKAQSLQVFAAVFAWLVLGSPGVAQAEFRKAASFYRGEVEVMRLEYEIQADGMAVRWRVTNLLPVPLLDVGIEDKEYTLSDGTKAKASGEQCGGDGKLAPSASCKTMWDYVHREGKPKVTDVAMKHPYVHFRLERGKPRYHAGKEFTVK